jgi:hypothetical protein
VTIRSRIERLEVRCIAAGRGRLIVVPIAYGEPGTTALEAAGVIPEPQDLVVFVTDYGGGPCDYTPTITWLENRS